MHQGTRGGYVNRGQDPSRVRVARVLQGQHASWCVTKRTLVHFYVVAGTVC